MTANRLGVETYIISTVSVSMSDPLDTSDEHDDRRARIEPHLMATFHQQRVLFEEGRVKFHATATLECDDWGVTVRLVPETTDNPLTVSGAWGILSVWANRVGAAYVGWGVSLPQDPF